MSGDADRDAGLWVMAHLSCAMMILLPGDRDCSATNTNITCKILTRLQEIIKNYKNISRCSGA